MVTVLMKLTVIRAPVISGESEYTGGLQVQDTQQDATKPIYLQQTQIALVRDDVLT